MRLVEAVVTYNFDPERWYENERAMLEARLRSGQLDRRDYERELKLLGERLSEMWDRLQQSYRLRG